ncbi:nucleotide pyrophosphohydrolase [Pontibacter pamirensis]|uniref:nucleotide pyrophosphohydrolase n=1 Tax=Pontibacter pamirensis TaxID=2562824 RepID=UPI001389B2FF|nr:nucleotide pyrophosphohydrolase [Pontibacter pamirensis]
MKNIDLIDKIILFRDERNWKQFHSLKDLCLGIGIEVAELQELFLWKTEEQIETIKTEKKEQLSDELADIFIFLAYLSNDLGIDLDEAVLKKIEKNGLKYPRDRSLNSNKKYNEL